MEQLILAIAMICKTEAHSKEWTSSTTIQETQRTCVSKILTCYADGLQYRNQEKDKFTALAKCLNPGG